MKQLSLALFLAVAPAAQAETPAPPPAEDGFDLMEEGAKLLFRGLMSEMEPTLKDMGDALRDIEPALRQLLAQMDDIRNYEAPRMLENGDILIPRRKDAPPRKPVAPNPEIEL